MSYPPVHDEFETLALLKRGYSIARFGDGEFKLMDGKDQIREPANASLAAELRHILRTPTEMCLVGIPTMDKKGAKYKSWIRHEERFAKILRRARHEMYSAFISRPDSAPWIRTRNYAEGMQSLWAGKYVAVVCENGGSALRAVTPAARHVEYHECPTHRTYSQIEKFEQAIVDSRVDIAILSCGPAATCLANRLSKRGIQAIDFGSGGSFIAKLLRGDE